MSVLIETTLGDIVIDLYTAERKRCCLNFLKLCKIKYYNYSLFFSVQRNYVAQTGDPTGTGRGGESIYQNIYGDQAKFFEMELKPKIKHTKKGLVSFVNNGNNQHGSQFFFTLASSLDYLDGKHTVFGEVSEGFDVLDKINEAICDDNDRPYQDIRINHTIILDDPFDDPDGLQIPERSPEPTKEQLKSDRIGADEKIDEFEGKELKEIEDIIEEKDLKIGTQILETIGDIPDAELKPPENVLFVCKLNPVTTADDLEIIFSRFGKILSCEIIRDHKTGDSLCYGFIEFAEVEECNKAYFKMENVLIDDRRIHVDFCQSITKSKWSKSGLHGKYAFETKDKSHEQSQPKPKAKKLEIRERSKKDQYEMVFDESRNQKEEIVSRKSRTDERKYKKGERDYAQPRHDIEAKPRGRDRSASSEGRRKSKEKMRKRRSDSLEDDRGKERGKLKRKKGKDYGRKNRYSNSDSDSAEERGKELKRKEGKHKLKVSRYEDSSRSTNLKKKKGRKKRMQEYSSSDSEDSQSDDHKRKHASKGRR